MTFQGWILGWDSLGNGVLGVPELVLIGAFVLVDGYLVRAYQLTGLILWTNPGRAGLSTDRLTWIVGTHTLLLGVVTFAFAGVVALGAPPSLVEPAYYAVAIVLVVLQYLHVRLG